ncbi:MAG: hypothetical protein QOJ17_488 [Rhodospirillaceae bacterium]|nr:hypothetical protein [Rhodospirillaceae bacterium]
MHAGLWLSGRHPPAGLKYLAKFHELEVSHGGCALDHFGARALHGGSDWIGAAFCGAGFFSMHESCATPAWASRWAVEERTQGYDQCRTPMLTLNCFD